MKSVNIKKFHVSKRKNLAIIIALIFMMALIPVSIYLLGDSSENRTVLKVNGSAVSEEEFKVFLMDNVANTYHYFKEKYNVDDSDNFWNSSYGKEIPIEYARENALKQVTKRKIEQVMAKERGLLKDISYTGFLKSFQEENQRRKESVSQGRVIYGPMQYQQLDYFRYVHSKILINLKEKLGQKELAISDEEIKKYYDLNRETHFKKNDDIKVQIITGIAITDKGVSKILKKDEVQSRLEKLKARMDKGEAFEDVAKSDEADGTIKINMVEKSLIDESSRTDIEEYPVAVGEANKLSLGKTSEIFEENGYLRFIKCIERKDKGYGELDELKGTLKINMLDEKYVEMINRLTKEAKVEIVNSVYKKIMPR